MYPTEMGGIFLAGNETEKLLSFSVNRKGTSFELLEPEAGGLILEGAVRPAVRLQNVDQVSIISVALNKEAVERDGKYIFPVTVRDSAGNLSVMEPVEFFLDTEPSAVTEEEREEPPSEAVSAPLERDNAGDAAPPEVEKDAKPSDDAALPGEPFEKPEKGGLLVFAAFAAAACAAVVLWAARKRRKGQGRNSSRDANR